MRVRDPGATQWDPLCAHCQAPIRPIERVPAPDGRPVHFYCFPIVRGPRAGKADGTAPRASKNGEAEQVEA